MFEEEEADKEICENNITNRLRTGLEILPEIKKASFKTNKKLLFSFNKH